MQTFNSFQGDGFIPQGEHHEGMALYDKHRRVCRESLLAYCQDWVEQYHNTNPSDKEQHAQTTRI
jgi:hypothetical protein